MCDGNDRGKVWRSWQSQGVVATDFSSIIHLWLDLGEKDKQFCLSFFLERPGIAVQEESLECLRGLTLPMCLALPQQQCECPDTRQGAHVKQPSTELAAETSAVKFWKTDIFLYLILSFFPALASSSFLTLSSGLTASVLSPVVFGGFHNKHLIIMRMMFLEAGDGKAQTWHCDQPKQQGREWLIEML